MQKISLAAAAGITSPNPVSIVCTLRDDGKTNLATVSWWTYLSYKPDMIAYAMAKTSFSGELVRQNKKVILTVPSERIADAALMCGMTTGRDTDKAAKFGIELVALPESGIKIPAHSCLAAVCALKEFVETGDHYLYICNVEQVYGDKNLKALFAWNGYSELRTAE